MAIIDNFSNCMNSGFSCFMRCLGYVLSVGLYVILSVHTYAFFGIICTVLKKRLGVPFGLVWIGIGITLLYNIIFNHFFAMTVKPGSPKDLIKTENKRKENKNR